MISQTTKPSTSAAENPFGVKIVVKRAANSTQRRLNLAAIKSINSKHSESIDAPHASTDLSTQPTESLRRTKSDYRKKPAALLTELQHQQYASY